MAAGRIARGGKDIPSSVHRRVLGALATAFAGLGLAASPAAAFSGGTLISQGLPAYSSGNVVYSVHNMVDSAYNEYRCTPTCAGIIDISTVPAAERGNDVLTWYNEDNSFDNVAEGNYSYNEPKTFTIDANSAPGGGAAPTSGWQTLKSVSNNIYDAGQYVVNLSGYNWVRMQVTASNGSSGNTDAAWHLDIVSCSSTCPNTGASIDTWLFLGDSITNNSMFQVPTSPPNFMQQVNATATAFYPSQINGGMSSWQTSTFLSTDSATGQPYIEDYLHDFPAAHFVTLNLGTNDLNGSGGNYNDTAATSFESNMAKLVQDVINAGRVPVVPTVPWAPTKCDSSGALANNNPATSGTPNYWITHTLYATYPQVVHGPDLWSYFDQHQSLIATSGSPGCPHPTAPTGENDYRALWATTMLSEVYASSGPVVSFSPGGVSFGSERVGTTSALQQVSLTNSGNAGLSISSIVVAGANAGDFAQSNNCPAAPATLAAGSSCSISVAFTPTAPGTRTASVQVTDNAADSPQSVGLSGTGTAPAVTLAPSGGVSFGSELVGTTSGSQPVTLTNSGTAALSISSIALTGANPGDFAQTNNCPGAPSTVAVGSSCSISVTFTPSAAGTRSANVTVTDDAADSPQTEALTGTGGSAGAMAFDKTLGQLAQNASGSTLKLTTSAPARPGHGCSCSSTGTAARARCPRWPAAA
jgi:hypothetical protein